jgi:hypothetical protein
MHSEFLAENLKGRDQLGDQAVDVRIILERVLKETGSGPVQGPVASYELRTV